MAKNPDPNLSLTTITGATHTLDDWTTMFHLVLVVLPDDPAGAAWIPVARRIFSVFGDSDSRVAFVVPSTPAIARRILDHRVSEQMVFVDPDRTFVEALGLTSLPAFVHLRQNATVAACAEGAACGDAELVLQDGLDFSLRFVASLFGTVSHARRSLPARSLSLPHATLRPSPRTLLRRSGMA